MPAPRNETYSQAVTPSTQAPAQQMPAAPHVVVLSGLAVTLHNASRVSHSDNSWHSPQQQDSSVPQLVFSGFQDFAHT